MIYRNLWIFILICNVFVIFDLTNQASSAQEWPQWRGPKRDGMITEFTAPQVWPDSLKLKWKIPVGTGHSSPVVTDGRIYIHTRQNEEEVVSCLNLENSELLWRKNYPVSYTMNSAATGHGKGPKSTPVLHGGKLYTLGISGILSCFDARTGALKWRKEFSKRFSNTSPLYGTAMSPLVEKGLLIAHLGGHDNGALTAFDVETGNVKWSWEGDGPAYASPIVVELEGTRQIVTQTQNYCVGISAVTGELLWRIPFTTMYDQNIVTPVLYNEMLIFSGVNKGTMAIKVIKKGNDWSTEQIWHNPKVSMYMNSPVLSGDLLFGFSPQRSGHFFCLDVRTGSTLWTSDDQQGENAAILSAEEVLFFLTNNAKLFVVKRNVNGFEPIIQYTVADSPTWAHPVILGNQILIKDASTLARWSVE
ncbi:serine/threonine protein kinase [Candidatus Poribacteria bacterium]|nr:serine/threonine protein kinase [Candidatus Poribacteria bacterium]